MCFRNKLIIKTIVVQLADSATKEILSVGTQSIASALKRNSKSNWHNPEPFTLHLNSALSTQHSALCTSFRLSAHKKPTGYVIICPNGITHAFNKGKKMNQNCWQIWPDRGFLINPDPLVRLTDSADLKALLSGDALDHIANKWT